MLQFRCVAPGLGSPQALSNRAIDVWAFSLLADRPAVEQWRSLLSSDERHRAERFVRAPDADAFVVAHGTLRALLARYCAVAPGQLRFTRSSDGKPMLESLASAARAIRFNLAHSANAALVAVSAGAEVGIDLECVRDDVDIDGLAARYFTGYEREMIATEAPERRVAAFFRFWVAKEAVLKARGSGLATPLDAFSVRFAPDGESASVDARTPAFFKSDYGVRMLPVPAGWHAALCAPVGCEVRMPTA